MSARWASSASLVALVVAASSLCSSALGFSAPAPDGIKIVGLPGGQIQSLPSMYVKSFRRWIVEGDGDGSEGTVGGGASCASRRMEPIQGAGLSLDEGWANPTSTDELWWPRDLSPLQARPALNVLFRNGVLSYLSAGLDVRVPRTAGDDGGGGAPSSWRNHGLNSQPIARQWTSLDIAMEKLFHVEGFILRGEDHETLFPSLNAGGAMQRVASFIAELDALSPLADGFHIASFPMTEHWTDLPSQAGSGDDDADGDETEALYKIVCLGTSEPFANKLLDMDEDLLTMSSSSVLEVGVSRTAKGGDSPYLTEPYKALYSNGQSQR